MPLCFGSSARLGLDGRSSASRVAHPHVHEVEQSDGVSQSHALTTLHIAWPEKEAEVRVAGGARGAYRPSLAVTPRVPLAQVLKALPGHADRCGEVRRTATEAHAKHLRALHEASPGARARAQRGTRSQESRFA